MLLQHRVGIHQGDTGRKGLLQQVHIFPIFLRFPFPACFQGNAHGNGHYQKVFNLRAVAAKTGERLGKILRVRGIIAEFPECSVAVADQRIVLIEDFRGERVAVAHTQSVVLRFLLKRCLGGLRSQQDIGMALQNYQKSNAQNHRDSRRQDS